VQLAAVCSFEPGSPVLFSNTALLRSPRVAVARAIHQEYLGGFVPTEALRQACTPILCIQVLSRKLLAWQICPLGSTGGGELDDAVFGT